MDHLGSISLVTFTESRSNIIIIIIAIVVVIVFKDYAS
jgi:hypothetical protein